MLMIGCTPAGPESEKDGDEKSCDNQDTGCPPGEAGRAKERKRADSRPIAGVAGVIDGFYPPEVGGIIIQFQVFFFGNQIFSGGKAGLIDEERGEIRSGGYLEVICYRR